jgi:peptidoglycan/LPS O-acetylase OafA/YrhL
MKVERPHHNIPSLDGIRAIAIMLVVVSHLVQSQSFLGSNLTGHLVELGQLGVRIFFVLSGFLITTLLLKELDTDGHIRLGRFYFRRTLRIFPPYYTLIFVTGLLAAVGWVQLNQGDIFHALSYTSNYYPTAWSLGHSWSLSVEEQFYLLWPATLLLLGKKRGIWVALAMLVLCPLIRLFYWKFVPDTGIIEFRFEAIADYLAVGCVLAGTRGWLREQRLYQRLQHSKLMLLLPLIILFITYLGRTRLVEVVSMVGMTVMIISIAACLDYCVTNHSGRIGRVLNSKPLVRVGAMSYSIYLWQQLFLNPSSSSVVNKFPLNIALVCVCALLCYHGVEQPALRFRRFLDGRLYLRRRSSLGASRVLPDPCDQAGAVQPTESI